jgi:hypothetical protein
VNPTVTNAKYDIFPHHTQRETDPLQPYYYINGSSYSDIEKNKPSHSRRAITDSKLLRTDDIEGAQAGYILHHRLSIPEESRREYRNINYLDDIQGAHADTVKHSIQTTRTVNPLVPRYQSLDGNQELLVGPCEALVPPQLIDQKSDFKSYGTVRGGGGRGGERTLPPSRHNLFSRSGNSVLSPSFSKQSYPPLSPCVASGGDGDGGNHSSSGYYTYHYDETTGTNGIALSHGATGANELSLSQSRSYAEKYFPPTMDLLSPQGQSSGTPPPPICLSLSFTLSLSVLLTLE